MIRQPAVAGYFYPKNPGELKKNLAELILSTPKKISAKGIMVPHAGYMYSGKVAGQVYGQVEIPDRLIILSPNHTGLGAPFSIMNRGTWKLPMGDVLIDEELADKLMEECPLLKTDEQAHANEHSLEVQIPFLQFLKTDFRFVPITIGHVRYESCAQLGEAIARIVKKEKSPPLAIASTDLNHYEDHETTLVKDQWAIDQVLKLDPKGLYDTVHEKGVSMCGIIPTTVMLVALNKLGATKATLVDHKTSGDVTGDKSAVVGYAGVIIT